MMTQLAISGFELVPLMGIGIGALWIVCTTIDSICRNAGRERTKREIAAYIAEGSMTPDEGERILTARPGKSAATSSEES